MALKHFHCWDCGKSILKKPWMENCFFWCDFECKKAYEDRIKADKKKCDNIYKAWNKSWDNEIRQRDQRISDRLAGHPWPDEIIESVAQRKKDAKKKRKSKKPGTALAKIPTNTSRPSARRGESKRNKKNKIKMTSRVRQMAPVDAVLQPSRQNKCTHCHKKGHNIRSCKDLQ